MARVPRKRVSLSFSDGHRLAAAFAAAGMGSVPGTADLRTLLELGLAAKAAGLLAVRNQDGCYVLVQAVGSGSGRAILAAAPHADDRPTRAVRLSPDDSSPATQPTPASAAPAVEDRESAGPERPEGRAKERAERPKVSPEPADNGRSGAAHAPEAVTANPELPVDAVTSDEVVIDESMRDILNAALQF